MAQEGKYSRDAIDDVSDSESRLRLILDKTPALIYSARPDGSIDFVNECLLRISRPSFRGNLRLGLDPHGSLRRCRSAFGEVARFTGNRPTLSG
jgi:hypothetical protein